MNTFFGVMYAVVLAIHLGLFLRYVLLCLAAPRQNMGDNELTAVVEALHQHAGVNSKFVIRALGFVGRAVKHRGGGVVKD